MNCATSGVDCNTLDSSDIGAGAVGTSEITDGSIATVDIGSSQVTSAKVDASICKATGTNCKAWILQKFKISGTGATGECIGGGTGGAKRVSGRSCDEDCAAQFSGSVCQLVQTPNCNLGDCGDEGPFHTQNGCICLKIA